MEEGATTKWVHPLGVEEVEVNHKAFAQLVADECGYSASTCERVMDCYWKNVLDVLEESKMVSVYNIGIQLILAVIPAPIEQRLRYPREENLAVIKTKPKKKYLRYQVRVAKYRYYKWLWMKNQGHQFIKLKGDDSE
jgi:hypothetical protein